MAAFPEKVNLRELVAGVDPSLNVKTGKITDLYELGEEIGCGSYGQALRARRKEDGLEVVVKRIRLAEMDDKARQDTINEAKVLAQFNHVNIVHYHGLVLENHPQQGPVLNIVMEYANGGDLAAAIARRQREKRPFTEDEIMFWFVQVVLALFHVHGKQVLHRDVKSQNIFIAEGNVLKLGDFGIARVLNSDTELARTVIGSPYYLSPEICEDRPYNRKSDVWSLGCVLYELATLRRAFDGNSLPALVVKILRGKYPPVPTRYSSSLRGLIESMLKQDPKERPGADAILKSDYVRHHVERYAAHVMDLGLGLAAQGRAGAGQQGAEGAAAGGGKSAAAAAAAALGLAGLCVSEARPKAGLPSRPQRAVTSAGGAARPPRAPGAAAGAAAGAGAGVAASPLRASVSAGGALGAGHAPEAGLSTPGDGSSPAKLPLPRRASPAPSPAQGQQGSQGQQAQGQGQGQHRLVGSTWIRKQEAALSELEGALAKQKAGAVAGVGAPGAGAGAAAANGSVPVPSPGPGGAAALDATVLSAAASPGVGNGTAAKAKLLELKVQREAELEAQRRAVAAAREHKKAAAARRSHEVASAVRGRVAERHRDIERHLSEQKAEMEAKARKALELAAAIKAKEEARKREAEEVAQHMSAHREQVRAARARVSKEQLNALGAQFAARLASSAGDDPGKVVLVDFGAKTPPPPSPSANLPSLPSTFRAKTAAASPSKAQPSSPASKPSPRPGPAPAPKRPTPSAPSAAGTPKSPAPGALAAAVPAASPASAAGARRPAARPAPSPAGRSAGASASPGRPGPGAGAGAKLRKAVVAEAAGPSPSARPRPAAAPPSTPPWKQHRQHGGGRPASEFPEVQIFTPFGSNMDDQGQGQEEDGVDSDTHADEEQQAAAGVLEMLAQIHTVLGVDAELEEGEDGEGDEDSEAAPPTAAARGAARAGRSSSVGGVAGGGGGGSSRPPNRRPGSGSASAGGVAGGAVGLQRGGRSTPGADEDGDEGPGQGPQGRAAAAAANALKVEQLRIDLERDLGAEVFVAAYRCLRDMQDRADDGEGDGEGDAGGELERLLGRKLHLARLLHKLVMLEETVFT